ncbi:MAG TPA: hypothetical protein VF192_01260 [Longimicrobiales bacterium]
MEAAAQNQSTPEPEGHGVPGLPQDAPPSVIEASQGNTKAIVEEKSALDWLLGATTRLEHDVPFKFETPDGLKDMSAHIHQVDGARLEALEEEHRIGDGPFSKLNVLQYNAAVFNEAVEYVTDETGRKVTVPELVGNHPAGAVAGIATRFKYQPGILQGIEREVRQLAAYSSDRVGSAQRSLVAAVGNSSS